MRIIGRECIDHSTVRVIHVVLQRLMEKEDKQGGLEREDLYSAIGAIRGAMSVARELICLLESFERDSDEADRC